MTTPTEFTLWLNGVLEMIDPTLGATPNELAKIRAKHQEVMGHLAKNRIMEAAEDAVIETRQREEKRRYELEAAEMKMKLATEMAKMHKDKADRAMALIADEPQKYDTDDIVDAVAGPEKLREWFNRSPGMKHPGNAGAGMVLGGLRADAVVSGEVTEAFYKK